jgi:RNA polymerase sigma-70 factor (ECF subfamily)
MLTTLYRHHAPALFRFALRLTGNHAAAEDLVADTFVVAVAGGSPSELSSARAFLFGTLRNLALHRRRDASRRPRAPFDLVDSLAGSSDPERDAAARSDLAATFTDLQALSEDARSALLLRAEGLPYEEIAEVLGVSEGAVKVRVHRARVMLATRRSIRTGEVT